ncbi:MAG: DUF1573 domain-containing protein [Planctomycetaceae bacterium]|nr:DUF1573 domain-containing protein [Planctomycetaceae bacterium]
MGEIYEGQRLTHQVTFSNISGTDLEDIRLTTSCGCTHVNPDRLSLAAGESQAVELEIHTEGFLQRSPRFSETFQVALRASLLDDDNETQQETFTLGGTVKRWAIPTPASLEFEGMNPIVQGDVGRRELTLQLDDGIELSSLSVDHPEGGKVDIRREAQLTKLVYSHRATEQTGDFKGLIRLSATRNGNKLPPVRIPVRGTVVPPYELIPRQVAIPPQPVGQVLTRTVKLRSLRNIGFDLETADIGDERVTVEILDSDKQSTVRELKLSITVSEAGDHLYKPVLRILPHEGERAPVELTIPIRAYGIDRNIAQQTPQRITP